MSLDINELKRVLHYNPKTGIWHRRVANRNQRAGARADKLDFKGYRKVYFAGKLYESGKLAWFYIHGYWPPNEIDHRNHKPHKDNRIKVLRLATRTEQQRNRRISRRKAVPLKGVTLSNAYGKYRAHIGVNRKSIYLGQFDCPAAAHFAYVIAADKYFGEFACAG